MTKATTVYLDMRLLQAAKVKAVQSHTSLSSLVSEALKMNLREDSIDLRAIRDRKKESVVSFEVMLKNLKKDGLL